MNSRFLLFYLMLLFFWGCNQPPKYVLEQQEMEDLLFDMHLLEASLKIGGYRYGSPREQQFFYGELLDKYGLSKATYDSCLSWYTRHPRYFERICENVLVRLDTLSNEAQRGIFHLIDSVNAVERVDIWTLPRKYILPPDSPFRQVDFCIEDTLLTANDRYELILKQRIGKQDSSLRRHIVLYLNYLNGEVDSVYTTTHSDNLLRRYTLRLKADKPLKIKSISGYLLGRDTAIGEMNATIDSIHLIRIYNPYRQDSIRKAVGLVDTTTYPLVSIEDKKQLPTVRPKLNPNKLLLKEFEK